MKKITMFIIALVVSLSANAQFEKGKIYLGASLTGLDMSYSGLDKFHFGLEAQGGYLIMDNVMLKASAAVDYTGRDDAPTDFTIGAGGRYYIIQNGLYLGANVKLLHANHNYNDIMPGIEVGYAFFVNRYLTIEPSLYYKMSLDSFSKKSTVGARIGLGFYF